MKMKLLVNRLADLKEPSMSLKKSGKLPRINGDGQCIKQVFSNLLINAIRYTPNKGRIEVEAENENKHLLVSISDNGIGIPRKSRKRYLKCSTQGRAEEETSLPASGTPSKIAR